ncbi:MAG TPA: ABC transporter substrate-binding protein [Candidatus Omnitrophica bacterium]|nr:ABC transporter substrate-binding protein [Candidatus Omnitrophota bacterium]
MNSTQTKHIRFGHSPDPDDAFMFYAFAYETIPMRGFKVTHVIEDIESLNQRALKNAELEVTAVSCHAYAYLADKYAVMRSGASIGEKYGPILVSRTANSSFDAHSIRGKKIAIPGKLTTAYLTLQIFQKDFQAVFIPFDKIMDAVKEGFVDFGLVIHEGQLTHASEGLHKVLDLGEWWHQTTGLPLPLGVDVIRKDLGKETMREFGLLFKESIEHSLKHRQPALDYAIQYGRGLNPELNDKFVGMYVNDRTVEIGTDGEAGFRRLLDEGYKKGIIPKPVSIEFVS